MSFSYWEKKEWFSSVDFTVIGSGIVGLNCALALKNKYPNSKILILEKGMLPQGASSKNAGFACFGSLSELVDDLKSHSEQEVFDLVKKRWEGLLLMRKILGDKNIGFQQNGGFELYQDKILFEECLSKKKFINQLLEPIFKKDVFSISDNTFDFRKIHPQYTVNSFEAQIDTGKMISQLLLKVQKARVKILNNFTVEQFEEASGKIYIKSSTIDFYTKKIFLATNGFSKKIVNEDIQPARAQVLITKPIENLNIKGTFHLDKGYYYFRNIDNRVLFGGGRNLDFKTEETAIFGETKIIQNQLEQILKEVILSNKTVEIDYRWSGIMGIGNQKKAIVKQLSENAFCGIRLGGMGVAIGNLIGKELADLV